MSKIFGTYLNLNGDYSKFDAINATNSLIIILYHSRIQKNIINIS